MRTATNRRPTESQLRVRYPELIELVEQGTAPERSVRALELLRRMPGPEVAHVMGVSNSRLYELLSDPLQTKAKVRKHKRFGICVDCGVKTFNNGSMLLPKRCHNCAMAWQSENAKWQPEVVIDAIQRWHRQFGRPPVAVDWNAGWLRDKGEWDRLRVYEQGDWPATGTVQYRLGSWSAAIEAAGFERHPQGGGRGPGAVTAGELAGALAFLKEGLSYREIGLRYGVTGTEIRRRIQIAKGGVMPVLKAEQIIEREIERNEERRKVKTQEIEELEAEHGKLLVAKAALNGGAAKS